MSADSGDRLPEGDELDDLSDALPVQLSLLASEEMDQLSLLASEGVTHRESGRITDATSCIRWNGFPLIDFPREHFLRVNKLMKGSFVMGGLSLCS